MHKPRLEAFRRHKLPVSFILCFIYFYFFFPFVKTDMDQWSVSAVFACATPSWSWSWRAWHRPRLLLTLWPCSNVSLSRFHIKIKKNKSVADSSPSTPPSPPPHPLYQLTYIRVGRHTYRQACRVTLPVPLFSLPDLAACNYLLWWDIFFLSFCVW